MFANDFGVCPGTNMGERVRVLDFNLVVLNSNRWLLNNVLFVRKTVENSMVVNKTMSNTFKFFVLVSLL